MREKLVLSKEGLQFSKVVLDWFWLAGEHAGGSNHWQISGVLRVVIEEFP